MAGNWDVEAGSISGSGDSEKMVLSSYESYSESDPFNIGNMVGVIKLNQYNAGSGNAPTIYYKTGVTQASCEQDLWHLYNGVSFNCKGWVKIRLYKAA